MVSLKSARSIAVVYILFITLSEFDGQITEISGLSLHEAEIIANQDLYQTVMKSENGCGIYSPSQRRQCTYCGCRCKRVVSMLERERERETEKERKRTLPVQSIKFIAIR